MNEIIEGLQMDVDAKSVELLRQVLRDNEFKETPLAAILMLDEMRDRGLPNDAYAFYSKVALSL